MAPAHDNNHNAFAFFYYYGKQTPYRQTLAVIFMKASKILGIVFLLAGLLFYIVVLGGPFRRTLTVGGCEARYTHFLTNNRYCNWQTDGHCPDNSFERCNAIIDVTNCLWTHYLLTHDQEVIVKIEELIKGDDRLVSAWTSKSVVERVENQEKILFGHLGIE